MKFRCLPACVTLVALLTPVGRHASAQSPQTPPALAESEDVSAHEGFMVRTVRAQLVAEKFDELDQLADQLRRDKARWKGGEWKLRTLYQALDAPFLTDKDSVEHLEHLRRWIAQRPKSVTARIALATSLHRWAWVARGNGVANTVTEEGWRLFNQRIAEAQAVLTAAQDMVPFCPQWYSEEMTVGLAQGWDARQMKDLFDRAVQFEPGYFAFYRARTNYLLPKWYGSANDATNFAKSAADRDGGDAGDVLYFEIATAILHRGNFNLTPFLKALDWERIQHGYAALKFQYGVSRKEENQLAFMAYKYKDTAIAQPLFASIGDQWSRSVWKDRSFFDRARDWSTGHTQLPAGQ